MPISVNGPGTPGPRGPAGPTGAQGASGTISSASGISLGGTLEMSGHVVPNTTDTYDLGNPNQYFRDLYIGTGSIIMMSADGNSASISLASDGALEFKRQTRFSLSSSSGKTTKLDDTTGNTGSSGGTGATGCGSAINFKFGGGTEDSQGLFTKGKFWTVDDANDSGCTFMNMDAIYINNWEDSPCDRNFAYYMQSLPYCGRIDIFPQGFSGGNQAWARFFYSGHYGIGGATQSGSSAGYHKFNIDTNHPIHTMNSSAGGSAAFTLNGEYEVHFSPMCSSDSDNGDGASGGSGGSSGGDGGSTIEPPAPTYPCVRRSGLHPDSGFTLEGGSFAIGNIEGYYKMGGSGASGGQYDGGPGVTWKVYQINTISELYMNNFAPSAEGFYNDAPFFTSLNQNGRVTVKNSQGASSDTWVRYNYSAVGVSGGTGDGGYLRFTGMTLDAFGPAGNTATAIFRFNTQSEFCFENLGATCNPNEYTFTFRGITNTNIGQSAFTNSVGTGDMWFHDYTYDAGATFGQMRYMTIDHIEDAPCNRLMNSTNVYAGCNSDGCASVLILPEDYAGLTSDVWVNYKVVGAGFSNTGVGGTGSIHLLFPNQGNLLNGYNGPSGGTAMLEVGKRYVLSFAPSDDGDGGSGGATLNPPTPPWPCTYRFGATQGATANRDPGNGFFGVSGASVGYTTLGGGATVADIRYINGMYVDTYSPDGDGTRYDGDNLDSLSQTGQLTLTRTNGGTGELWAKYNYTYHAGTGGSGGYRIFSGMTLAAWGPSGGYTSGSYGDFHIPMERTNVGVVPWNMCFENVAGYTCEDNSYTFTFRGITNSSDAAFANSIGTGDMWFRDITYDAGATFGQMYSIYFDKWEDGPCNRNMVNNLPSSHNGNLRLYPEDYNGLTSDTWVQFYHNLRYVNNGYSGYSYFHLDNYPNSAVRAFNGPSGGTAMLEVGKRYHMSFHPEVNDDEDNDGGSGGSTAHPDAPAYPCTYRYGATQGATANRDPGNAFYGVSGASVGYTTLGGGATVADIRYINGFYVDNYAANGAGARYDGDFFDSLSQTGQLTLTRTNGGTGELWAKYNYTYHAGTGGSGGYRIFSGMTLAAWGPSGGYTSGTYGDFAIPMERTNVGVVPWNMCFENVAGHTCEDNSYTFTFRGITNTSPGNTTFTNSIGTGDLWFHDASYDAGATFGQMTDVLFDRWEDDPCNREMGWGAVPYYPLGNLRLYPEDHNGLTSDTWVQYYHMDRNFIGNQEDGVWRFVLDNHPNSAVRAFNGPSGGTAMLEVGKRYHLSFHTETNSNEDNDGGSGGSTAHPDAPAYPCTYRYGATQGATAHRDPGNGFFGVSGASVGYTTLGGGATVADIRSINEMFIDTYAPNGDGARYDGDFLEGLDQTGKITLTRMSGATSEVWARFSYDVHGNSAGTGGFHWFQGVTLDTWGPSGGYTSGSYGDFHIPMERTNVGVVPWKMCFENTAVTGPTASLGTNQFSFHHKVGTADSDPTYGFFKLGGTGAGDSLMEANSLFIDNFEENGEYGTGRYIGDFLDALDNTGTVKITPFGTTAGQQWVKYYYSTEVQGITSSGGSGGYHKILGLSGHSGNYLGSSFGVVPGTSGPYLIEFNETVAMSEDISTFINCPESFDNTGLAYGLYIRPYTTTIESIYLRTGTGGGCTGTVYVGGMQSLPVAGCSGMGVSTTGQRFHSATSGNTFSGGNTVGINQEVFLNLQGFTLAGSTGCPNYVVGSIRIRRTDGS